MEQNSGFAYRRVGSTGCEILNPNGIVIACTADELWATWIVALLNDDPCVRLAQEERLHTACCRMESDSRNNFCNEGKERWMKMLRKN